jgi:hypothetical protein
MCWRTLVALAVPVVSLVCHGCGDAAPENSEYIREVAGQWEGRDESGQRWIWIGLWGDQTYEWRELELRAGEGEPPLRAHRGRWLITGVGSAATRQIDLEIVVEESENGVQEALEVGTYVARLIGPDRKRWQLETPWGRYTVGRDEGA